MDQPGTFRYLPPLRRASSLIEAASASHDPRESIPGWETRFQVTARIDGHRRLRAHVEFLSRDDRRVISTVSVTAADHQRLPDAGVTGDALRALRLGKIQSELAEIIARYTRTGVLPRQIAEGFNRRPRPGSRGRPDRDYAAVADMYVNLLGTSDPVKRLAAQLNYSEAGIRGILARARDRGLLTKATHGKAGGALTPKARRILSGEDT